jgi:predicted dehydrogenase/threonine dehydrogenase-like Zn-dependent dehydrogenase
MRKNAFRAATVGAEMVPSPQCGRSDVLLANRHSLISAGTESTAVRSNKRDMVVKALRDPDIRQSVVDMVADQGIRRTADRVQYEFTKWTPLGYSGAGVAVEVGSEVEGIRPGDAVAYGGQGHAEYICAPKNLCVPVPQGVSSREAAFVALGSIALQGVRRAEVQVGDVVAVLGLGLVGQLVAQLLQAAGARVVGSDVMPERLDLARQRGLEQGFLAGDHLPERMRHYTDGIGVDRVLICASSSSPQVIEQAVAVSRDRGRIVVVGGVNLDVPRGEFYMKELDLVISRSYGPGRYDRQYEEHGVDYPIGYVRWTEKRNMEEFLRLIQAGKVDVKPLVTHEFGIDEADQGYDLLMNRPSECMGVLLKYDETAEPPRRLIPAVNRRPARIRKSRGNVAVFGSGAFARQFHLPNLKGSKQLNFHTLADASPQAAKEMAFRYGAARCTTDPSEVWEDPDVDAVMIITRDKSHTPLVASALEAGKHVFCEKPLATSYEECEKLAGLSGKSELVCMTGFNRRFAPMVVTAKEVLDGLSGPKVIHYRVNAGALPKDAWVFDPVHAEGRIVGEGCHFIDLFHWLTDAEPVRVSAHVMGDSPSLAGLEDVVASFDFSDGSIATLLYTAQGSTALGKERIEVFCDGTAIAMDNFRQLTVRGSQRIDVKARQVDKGHGAELAHFADAVLGRRPPEVTLLDGIRATVCCLKIWESATRREPVDVDMGDWVARTM